MSDQPSKEMVEAAARRLAYDYWPCATRDERNAWAEKYWPEHITKAEHAIIAALAARSHAPADRAEIVEECAKKCDLRAAGLKDAILSYPTSFSADSWRRGIQYLNEVAASIRSLAPEARQKETVLEDLRKMAADDRYSSELIGIHVRNHFTTQKKEGK